MCLMVLACILLFSASALSEEILDEGIKSSIIAAYDLDTAKVSIEIRKNRIKIRPDEYDSLETIPLTNSSPRGLLSFHINLYKESKLVRSRQVRVCIDYYDDVLVTSDRIRRHEVIAEGKFRIEKLKVTYLTDKPLKSEDELDGKWARRSIGKGQILTSGMVESIPAITSGQQVAILYRTPGFEISTRGVALEPGYKGESVRVRNTQSKKIIICTILDDKTVQVSSH
jgi:flagella basal body P-ring formation protein FlgA